VGVAAAPRNRTDHGRLVVAVVAVPLVLLSLLAVGAGAGASAGTSVTPRAEAGTTELISVSTAGTQGTVDHSGLASISDDGRYVAFQTGNVLAAGDTNGDEDVYVRDREAGTTTQVSVTSTGAQHNGVDTLLRPEISANGRYIAFDSGATNLVPSDGNARVDVFVRDRVGGTTERVSVSSAEDEGDNTSVSASISDDGRYVAFSSTATDLVADDDNAMSDIFVRDRESGTTVRASLTDGDAESNGFSRNVDISADGRYVAFDSTSSDLVADDENEDRDVFVRDMVAGTTVLVSQSSAGVHGELESEEPAISPDGRYVVFESDSTTLVAGDSNGMRDVFRHDLVTGTTTLVSVATGGAAFDGAGGADVSLDGTVVTFDGDPGVAPHGIFAHTVATGATELVSLTSTGAPASTAGAAVVSYDGLTVAFESGTEPMVPGDANLKWDVFLRVRAVDTGCVPPGPFPDVPHTNPFCGDILWLLDEGITTGYVDGTYRPSAAITRQSMAAFIYRYSGSPVFVPPSSPSFTDVPTSHLFYKEIEWMKANGLSEGYVDGTYRPTTIISRQVMAAFLYRLAGSPAFPDPVTPTFTDVPTSHLFYTEIEWLAAANISNGFGDGTYRPVAPVTRERMAAFLHDFDELELEP
jgi:Tol biopolymer transport system component